LSNIKKVDTADASKNTLPKILICKEKPPTTNSKESNIFIIP
jgi:hypothetical protein